MSEKNTNRITHLADRPLTQPSDNRLDPARANYEQIIAIHAAAIEAGQDGYLDPTTGAWVFTALSHANRGYCCNSGCRHCPYAE